MSYPRDMPAATDVFKQRIAVVATSAMVPFGQRSPGLHPAEQRLKPLALLPTGPIAHEALYTPLSAALVYARFSIASNLNWSKLPAFNRSRYLDNVGWFQAESSTSIQRVAIFQDDFFNRQLVFSTT